MADTERAKFSLADGRIEIEGSETFVAAQLQRLAPILEKMFQEPKPRPHAHAAAPAVHQPPPPDAANGRGLDNYLHLFAADAAGKLKILKSLPGDGKAGKTISAGLLLAFGNELAGRATTMDQVRAVCSEHACYDSHNFAQTFKKPTSRGYFTFSGSAPNQSVALTHPGRIKAEELAKSLNK